MRRKLLILVAVMALIAASCRGGGSSSTATEPPAAGVESTGWTGDIIAANKNESGNPADKSGAGEATGVVTGGDTRYDFAFSGEADFAWPVCRSVAGAVQAFGFDIEGRRITVDMWIPPEGWNTYADDRFDPPRFVIKGDEKVHNWTADIAYSEANPGDFVVGSTQVDDFVNDGFRASGTATFRPIRPGRLPGGAQPVEGTFEIQCPGQ